MRRPIRRRPLRRRFAIEQKRDFYLTLIKDIECMAKGNTFTAAEYLTFNDTDIEDITSASIDQFLENCINEGLITNLDIKDTDGSKTYKKTDLPYELVYDTIFNRYSRFEDDSSYTFNELIRGDYSIEMKKQLKEALENTANDSDLVKVSKNKDDQTVYTITSLQQAKPDDSILPAIFKVADIKVDEEFTLSEILGQSPTKSQILTFNALLEDNLFYNRSNDTKVVCKGLNSSNEMVYLKQKEEN